MFTHLSRKGTLWCVSVVSLVCCVSITLFFIPKYVSSYRPSPGTHYVCQTFNGRFANHLYQYASVYGIAKRHNMTIILGKDDDIVQYFELKSAEIRQDRRICQTFEVKFAAHCCVYDHTFMNLPRNQSYVLGEYLQSWKYFEDAFEEVRKELTIKKHIQEETKNIINDFREAYAIKYKQPVTVVGVHIRRGDVASDAFAASGGVRPVPDEYIDHAVEYVLRKFKSVVFIVCSDGMEYAKFILDYKNISVEFVHMSPIHDFALLASCDHVIMTVGSFGWWAGFLSRGTVIYYKYPMKEGTNERNEYNYEDHFPPHWIGLS